MNLVDFKELSIQSIELKELYANGTLIWQSARLPSEYQEVEFIYAADGAYINTGWVPSEGSTFNLIFYNYGNKPYPFGAGSSPRLAISKGATASMQIYNTSNSTGGIYNFVPVMWERLNLETYSTNTTESYVKLNGEIIRNNAAQNVDFNSALPMFLGAWSYSASSTRLGAAWIYYAKANVKGTDIFELIPCYRKKDGVIGMYDMISKEFFTNAGTGDFVAGPEVGVRKAVVNLLPTALTPNDITTVFDKKGYKNGYRASDTEPFYTEQESFFCTGLMPLAPHKTFYIKGCTLNKSTRVGLMRESGGFVNTSTLSDWVTGLTMTQLGEDYYSISIAPSYVSALGAPYYFYFSTSGTGDNVIVSHTPIE